MVAGKNTFLTFVQFAKMSPSSLLTSHVTPSTFTVAAIAIVVFEVFAISDTTTFPFSVVVTVGLIPFDWVTFSVCPASTYTELDGLVAA